MLDGLLGELLKPFFREVPVEAEHLSAALDPHDFKAGAIHETYLSTILLEDRFDSSFVGCFVYPDQRHNREKIFDNSPQRCHSKSALGQRCGLDHDVIAGNERGALV